MNPYQGMFFYDRELIIEHFLSPSFYVSILGIYTNLPNGSGVAEKANYGLTFHDVPKGFSSRNILKYFRKSKLLDAESFIHHLPNNYANDPEQEFGKIAVSDIFM